MADNSKTLDEHRVRPIESRDKLQEVMGRYFSELFNAAASGSPKIAWCTSVGPAELLVACGFKVYFPENHGAMLGASRMSTDLIPHANAIGYSPDICSYLTSDIGSFLKGKTPLANMPGYVFPKPDVLVFSTNQCRDVQDWFNFYHREFNCPVLGINSPIKINEISFSHIDAVKKQIESMVDTLCRISGRRFDHDKFAETLRLSKTLTERWKAVLDTAASHPAPINFFDASIHMGPAVVMRGSQEAIDYYDILVDELNSCVENKTGSIPDEKYRLYWEGMPIWGKLRSLSEQFAELNSIVVASTYCSSWVFEAFDPADPFTSMAKAYTEIFIVRADEWKERYLKKMFTKFSIDGIIYHDAKTCPNNSNNRYGMPDRLQKETGVPYITINGDLNDLRCYSEEQSKTNIGAFIEQLAENS
ncbi:MAG TPA: 2-hydroxyacyl-CoA dehydratase family protein [bacterium]|jgi:benzoyl-CoA reductase/2-hydroxyglutaryl-CoA dehydratase subunit BcrC/BadD/HgdB